jgi:glycosyltransferase involved in cell wall biosynthesis
MKVLEVIPFFSPKFGGSISVCYQLCRWLAARGHEVTVLTTDFGYDAGYSDALSGVTVIPFHHYASLGLFIYSPGMNRWLDSHIREYDLVHLHNYRSYQNNQACRYAKKYGIPFILQPHGSFPRVLEKEGLKKLYDLVWGDDIIRHARKIIAVSDCEALQFRDAGIPDRKISIIPNGLNLLPPEELLLPGRFRESLDLGNTRIVLFVGRIHKIKGIDFLIHAFHGFLQKWEGEKVVLIIAGPDGGYRRILEDLVTDLNLSASVLILDHLSDAGRAYLDADLLVYPSRYEIFGLVPLEALLYGTPVIVTDGCGCGELVHKAGCGYLVRFGDTDGLADTILHALNHREENRRMVERGQQYIAANLSWEHIETLFEEVYLECLR